MDQTKYKTLMVISNYVYIIVYVYQVFYSCYEQDAEVQDRAWPQGQNMPCAPTDHPVPNLTEGWGMKPPGGAEYTARG